MKTGRNDLCPCGSGKKYKKCCANRSAPSMRQDMKEDIHNLIGNQSFGSIEEVQAVLDQYQQQKNEVPVDDFHGLSSEQMHRFLHMPFETPELVTFPPVLKKDPESKAAFILSMLIKEIGEDGLKLTAKGNLGRKFCQQAFEKYQPRYPDPYGLKITIHSETNFEPLHAIRLTAQLAGLVRKYKGRLLLTKKCKKALDRHGLREIYPLLLHAYIRKFNWGYRDGFQEIPFIQQSFLFTLYLLHKYGSKWKPATFYSDSYLRAFPMILQEIEPKMYEPPEDTLQHGYILRTLQRFAGFFGLADLEQISEGPINREYKVRATGLVKEIVHFTLA
ncbi:MAG TPA: hypothetical protein EYG88_00695 [Desulfocapsa sulfexigens]|nr:hypothetical protein [Desulfocapsa sulfexigens]